MVFASACTSCVIFILAWLLVPHAGSISGADAVSVANTYIVFTTFLVTLFAIFVAIVSFYLAQNSVEMKMLKLQQDFEDHLTSDDGFAKKMKAIAEKHAKDQLHALARDRNMLSELVAAAVDAEVQKQAKTSEGMRKFTSTIAEDVRKESQ